MAHRISLAACIGDNDNELLRFLDSSFLDSSPTTKCSWENDIDLQDSGSP